MKNRFLYFLVFFFIAAGIGVNSYPAHAKTSSILGLGWGKNNTISSSMEFNFLLGVSPKPISLKKEELTGWKLPIRHYTSDDGMVFNEVISCFQDTLHGYLWFGTYAGLSRFDGKNFKNYTENNSGLGGSIIRNITEDKEHNIWVGYTGGIARLELDHFVNYSNKDGLLGIEIISLFPDPENGLWILTDLGVNYFDGKKFTVYPLDVIDTGFFSPLLAGSPQRHIFAVTRKGLFQKKHDQSEFKLCKQVDFKVQAIQYHTGEDALYLISGDKLYKFKEDTLSHIADSPLEDSLSNFFIGKDSIWLHSETMLWQRKSDGDKVFSNEMLHEPSISDVMEDREGNLWLTTWAGISMLVNLKVLTYADLPINTISRICKDIQGNLWVSGDQGIVKISPHGKLLLTIRSAFVEDMFLDDDKIIACVATYLHFYNFQGKLIKKFSGEDSYTYVLKDRNKKYWIASYNGLFSIKNDKLNLEIDSTGGLGSNTIWALFEDKTGALWVGTEYGLSIYNNGLWQHFTKEDGLSHNSIWHIYEHKDRGILVASSQGISKWNSNDKKFETTPFLSDKFITSLIAGPLGELWVGTEEGVFRINSENKIDMLLNKPRGMPANSTYVKSIYVDNPYLYVGTHNGLVRIELNIKNDKTVNPMLDLHEVNVNRNPVDTSYLSNPLMYYENNFTFRFNAIYTYLPDSISYRFFLKGMDEKWSEKSPLQQAVYTNLHPGDYIFHVQAYAEDGKKSDIKLLHFFIEKPFWQTWWFYSLEILISIAFIAMIANFVSQRRLRKSEEEKAKLRDLYEKQIELDGLKDDFLANTSHELRTPLNGIIGIAESLVDGATGPLSDETNSNLNMIVSSGRRLANLVNDILDFSKLKHKNIELQIRPIELRGITDVVLTLSGSMVANKPVKLINSISPDLPFVDADENRTQQIMHNLIGNAVKFTREGFVEISANVAGSMVEVRISDTGIGIDESKFDTIFESFEQADGSTSREFGGTGIGLSVTKQLVTLHGGKIRVESTVGEGSTFSFTLPVSTGQPVPKEKDKSANAVSAIISESYVETSTSEDLIPQRDKDASTDFPKIYVVDDEPINLQVVCNHLSLQDFSVITAEDGMEVLEAIEKGKKPDLILLDIMMPQKTGFEICQELRKTFSSIELPVIMLTAKNQVSDIVQGFESGANDYLTKPVAKNELIARVKTHINLAKANAQLEDYARTLEHKVEKRTEELKQTLEKVEYANKQIFESIQYAEKIQSSLLPARDMMNSTFHKHFIIWEPRDIVGGDIYLFETFKDGYLAVIIDCTGHGVPGAFMTMIAGSAFKRIVRNDYYNNPARILKALNMAVKTSLYAEGKKSGSDDGMDAAICFINTKKQVLTFAGAKLPLICVSDGKVKVTKGDRQSIGYKNAKIDFDFTNHEFPVLPGMSFYMSTDGITDQTGGPKRFPYGNKRFRNLLKEIAEKPFDKQKQIIIESFLNWKADTPRKDDVTVLGFGF
ncbi:two-component system, sensor histidine kinase ChiS [Candidatus Magnetomoraceae bacterium gMMP-15]